LAARPMADSKVPQRIMRRICMVRRFWVLVLGGCTAFPFVSLRLPPFSFVFLRLLELVSPAARNRVHYVGLYKLRFGSAQVRFIFPHCCSQATFVATSLV
jgi:hypothetical protein